MSLSPKYARESAACSKCNGQCCTFAPMTRREFKSIRKLHGIPLGSTVVSIEEPGCVMVVTDMNTGTCAYLKDGRCSIYEDRPWICRAYGDNDLFPCNTARPLDAQRKIEAISALKKLTRIEIKLGEVTRD